MMTIRTATQQDYPYLVAHDHHISTQILQRKIAAGEMFIAKAPAAFVGWLRYGFFWDSIPMMNMLFVEESYRGQGIGRQLVEHWEREMAAAGYKQVMTSTLSSESAQHFYRKLGYRDAGALLLPGEALEIVLLKAL